MKKMYVVEEIVTDRGCPLSDTRIEIGDLSVAQMLDLIAERLHHTGGEDLWNILTALRGPDDGNDHLKERTTLIVRGLAFPPLTETGTRFLMGAAFPMKGPDFPPSREALDYMAKAPLVDNHFGYHIKWAIDSLLKAGRL